MIKIYSGLLFAFAIIYPIEYNIYIFLIYRANYIYQNMNDLLKTGYNINKDTVKR